VRREGGLQTELTKGTQLRGGVRGVAVPIADLAVSIVCFDQTVVGGEHGA
jgi:hypothetical protein